MERIADRYELTKLLGQGGMGTVYLALDTLTGENVAIKQLQDDVIAGDPDMVERFIREGAALRQLNHPNIVKMLGTAQTGDTHYLILEYVQGGSLHDLLTQERQLSVDRVLALALELADALTRAHHLKIIHRDIKPANVLIAEDGTPRLTDFGVAHLANEQRVTESGVAVGTLDYLSPEALQGLEVDTRTDIWAFGVLLFELLAGRRPFHEASMTATMLAILQQPVPDLEAIRPDLPVALVDLVYRMLAKDRNQRIASMRLVGAQLEAILQGASLEQAAPRSIQFEPGVFDTPISDTDAKGHNLPQQSTPFIGREAELERLQHHLDDSQTRLVTILGPGGMGKTRLSLELAERVLHRAASASHAAGYFPAEAYQVELAPLTAADQIVAVLAEAVGFRFSPGDEPKAQLLGYLREKSLLLVLDNFEHLLAGADLVSAILKTAAKVKIIITSRERLNLQGELLFNISGMDIPDQTTPTDALNYSSIQLFVQSAKLVQPDFDLDASNLPAVLQIVRLVQGMPLAIILAASWLELLTPAEIAAEIEKSLDFLATELRDLPTRQRSIRAVFEYSWNLLTEAERDVFMKLSVFRGGFTREAAQAVAGASLRILMALVNKSLLRRDTVTGRYEVHELLRQYAASQLETAGEVQAVNEAHSQYYLDFLSQRVADLKSGRQLIAMSEIEADFQNCRIGWLEGLVRRDAEAIASAIDALGMYCDRSMRFIEGEQLVSQATSVFDLETYPQPGLKIRLRHSWLLKVGDLPGLVNLEVEVANYVLLARAQQNKLELAFSLSLSGSFVFQLEATEASTLEAKSKLQEADALYRELGEDYHRADNLSYIAFLADDMATRHRLLDEAIAISGSIGAINLKSWSLIHIAHHVYFNSNQLDQAEATFSEALELQQKLGDKKAMLWTVFNLNQISLYQGEFDRTRASLEIYAAVAESVNYPIWSVQIRAYLGLIAVMQEADYERGSRLCLEALATHNIWFQTVFAARYALAIIDIVQKQPVTAGDDFKICVAIAVDMEIIIYQQLCVLVGILLLSAQGKNERAAVLWGCLQAHPHCPYKLINKWKLINQQITQLQAEMDDKAYQATIAHGATLKLDEVIKSLLNA